MVYTRTQEDWQREQERKLRVARMVADKVTDEMLTKPVNQLTHTEHALLMAAFGGPFGEELIARLDQLNAKRQA